MSNWVFIMQRPLEIWLSFTNKKWQCARNLFQIHHTEQTPVVFVPKVVMRIVGEMPTTTCCKPLKSDFPITFVRLHFAFQPWATISMYWDTNCLTKIDGNVGHFPRFYNIWHQTCLLTSGALDHNRILMHSGQRCSMERSQNSKKMLLNRVAGMEVRFIQKLHRKGPILWFVSDFLKLHVPIQPLKVNESLNKLTL